MTISLPTSPAPNAAEPFLVDFGGTLTPFMGGPVQTIQRLGTRLGLRVTMPPMLGEAAMQFQSRLLRGKSERVILPWPLPMFTPGTTSGLVTSTTGAAAISVSEVTGGLVEGQPISIVHDGRRYMHLTTNSLAGDSGSVGIFPYARVAYEEGDTVEIGTPKIEGLVSPGDELNWSIALGGFMGFSFSVVETA